jgi:hypothetical protein
MRTQTLKTATRPKTVTTTRLISDSRRCREVTGQYVSAGYNRKSDRGLDCFTDVDGACWGTSMTTEEAMADDAEAANILRMLINKLHASVAVGSDVVHLDMKLTSSEMDRLCVWGVADEAATEPVTA